MRRLVSNYSWDYESELKRSFNKFIEKSSTNLSQTLLMMVEEAIAQKLGDEDFSFQQLDDEQPDLHTKLTNWSDSTCKKILLNLLPTIKSELEDAVSRDVSNFKTHLLG